MKVRKVTLLRIEMERFNSENDSYVDYGAVINEWKKIKFVWREKKEAGKHTYEFKIK